MVSATANAPQDTTQELQTRPANHAHCKTAALAQSHHANDVLTDFMHSMMRPDKLFLVSHNAEATTSKTSSQPLAILALMDVSSARTVILASNATLPNPFSSTAARIHAWTDAPNTISVTLLYPLSNANDAKPTVSSASHKTIASSVNRTSLSFTTPPPKIRA